MIIRMEYKLQIGIKLSKERRDRLDAARAKLKAIPSRTASIEAAIDMWCEAVERAADAESQPARPDNVVKLSK
jgi:hypothetical protein